jgi:hypothetical protein
MMLPFFCSELLLADSSFRKPPHRKEPMKNQWQLYLFYWIAPKWRYWNEEEALIAKLRQLHFALGERR